MRFFPLLCNHRYEAAQLVGITEVPCVVKTDLDEQESYKLALQSNSAAETVVPSTLVTYAEFVWARKETHSLAKIAGMMEWSEAKVKQYSALEAINSKVWDVVVTTFENTGNSTSEEVVTKEVTTVTFTERLLREILDLEADQQLELVQALAKGDIQKGKFKSQAEAYRARNEMKKDTTNALVASGVNERKRASLVRLCPG